MGKSVDLQDKQAAGCGTSISLLFQSFVVKFLIRNEELKTRCGVPAGSSEVFPPQSAIEEKKRGPLSTHTSLKIKDVNKHEWDPSGVPGCKQRLFLLPEVVSATTRQIKAKAEELLRNQIRKLGQRFPGEFDVQLEKTSAENNHRLPVCIHLSNQAGSNQSEVRVEAGELMALFTWKFQVAFVFEKCPILGFREKKGL